MSKTKKRGAFASAISAVANIFKNASGARTRNVVASYSAAKPTRDTWRAFATARRETTLQAQSRWTRESLRTLARQELETNPHAGGIARLFGLYVVGVGPRLKFKGFPKYARRAVSRELIDYVNYRWERFADDVQFATTLRSAMESLVVDGDAFHFFGANPRTELGLDLTLLDSQRVGNPDGKLSTPTLQDGVFLDVWGNPLEYCVYDLPKTEGGYYRQNEYQLVGARFVSSVETQQGFNLDDFNEVYALPGDGSDYGDAAPAGEYAPIPYDAWGTFHTRNGDSLVMPPGTTLKGFNPSQPTTEASAYTANILSQIGYSTGLPRNKATGSSHEYNFASGRLDNQPFEMLIQTLQLDLFERKACDRIFKYFYAALEPDLLERFDASETPTPDELEWEWVWPQPPLVDAESTARTNAIRLQSLQATLSEVWNETHAFSEFDDVRDQFRRDEKDFPNVFGVKDDASKAPGANTATDEPKAPPTRNF